MPRSKLRPSGRLFFLLLCLGTLAVECAVAALLLHGDTIPQGLVLHGLLVLMLAAWVYNDRKLKLYDNRFALLLLMLTALTGPFGVFVCILASAFHTSSGPAPEEWIEEFLAEDDVLEENHVNDMYGLEDISAPVEPFQDILLHGTVREKQIAIARITRHFRPSFGPMLVAATRDANAAVRVQAATAMATIERRFMTQYIALEKSVERSADAVARLRLAALYDDYAHANILDAHSCTLLRNKAIALYESHLSSHKDTDLVVKLARLYLRQDAPEKTCALLHPLVVGEAKPHRAALSWYMEALFRMRRFAEVRELALLHTSKGHEYPRGSTDSPLFLEEHYHEAA